MSDTTEQSAFLHWAAPNTTVLVPSTLMELRSAGDMGNGLFAVRDIRRGTRIIEEPAIMFVSRIVENTYGELNDFCYKFQQLTEAEKSIFDQLQFNYGAKIYGLGPTVSRWRRYNLPNDTDGRALQGRRRRQVLRIIRSRFLIFRGNHFPIGGGSRNGVFALFSRINHSCVPNAYAVFNHVINRLTVHAIRHIRAGEQITVSYIRDPTVAREVRSRRLARWNFTCSCAACTDPVMEARLERIRELKRLLASYAATNEALAASGAPIPSVIEALPAAMELVALLELQGIAGMELARAYNHCIRHSFQIGAWQSATNYVALEKLTKWYARGEDRLKGDGNDTENVVNSVEEGFDMSAQRVKEEPM